MPFLFNILFINIFIHFIFHIHRENNIRWQCRYVLMLWLSLAVLVPIDLLPKKTSSAAIDVSVSSLLSVVVPPSSSASSGAPVKYKAPYVSRLLHIVCRNLRDTSLASSAACEVAARVFTRPDLYDTPLQSLCTHIIASILTKGFVLFTSYFSVLYSLLIIICVFILISSFYSSFYHLFLFF